MRRQGQENSCLTQLGQATTLYLCIEDTLDRSIQLCIEASNGGGLQFFPYFPPQLRAQKPQQSTQGPLVCLFQPPFVNLSIPITFPEPPGYNQSKLKRPFILFSVLMLCMYLKKKKKREFVMICIRSLWSNSSIKITQWPINKNNSNLLFFHKNCCKTAQTHPINARQTSIMEGAHGMFIELAYGRHKHSITALKNYTFSIFVLKLHQQLLEGRSDIAPNCFLGKGGGFDKHFLFLQNK